MKSIIAALAFTFAASVAHAESVAIADVDAWTIYADTDALSCSAGVRYNSGRAMFVLFDADGAHWIINGLRVTEGQEYSARVIASNGEFGELIAVASTNSVIIFPYINVATLKALVDAQSIMVEGLGRFELTGSKRAIATAWQCFKFLKTE